MMSSFKDNLTFAIIGNPGQWRTDLTIRFSEYYSQGFSENFLQHIVYVSSVDEALDLCQTKYLVVQSAGNVIFTQQFFDDIEAQLSENLDIFLGDITIELDYLKLETPCIAFNLEVWNQVGQPRFSSHVLDGPRFEIVEPGEKYSPLRIKPQENDRTNVPAQCSAAGAELIIRQLEVFGIASALRAITSTDNMFFLSRKNPYHEIHFETLFEKKYLAGIHNSIFAVDDSPLNDQPFAAEVVVVPAQGMRALQLAEKFSAKKIVVYDISPLALEFQRSLLEVSSARLFSEVIADFTEKHPNASFIGDWSDYADDVVVPNRSCEVSYHLVDAFSHQMEDLIASLDPTVSIAIDFTDIYIYPYNFYRRPLYQAQGLFQQLYSQLKSRTGSTKILGYAPGFMRMDDIEINTSRVQFEYDVTPPVEETLTEAPPDNPLFFVPVIAVQPAEELNTNKWVDTNPIQASSPAELAKKMGYTSSSRSEVFGNHHAIMNIWSKIENTGGFLLTLEYAIETMTGSWEFRVGKVSSALKKITGGPNAASMMNHLSNTNKVRPQDLAQLG
jgi:hypothetical protein